MNRMAKVARTRKMNQTNPSSKKYGVGKWASWKESGAPYVEPDKSQLGDIHLNPEEAVAREREDLLRIEAKKRIHGQDELEKTDRSLGPRMFYTEILRRLRSINPEIHVLEGSPGSVALYAPKRKEEYHESDFLDIPPNGSFFIHHKYVGGVLKDWLPEWGHVTVDTSNVAHKEVRGWRSVLIGLIKAGIIPYDKTIKEFGDPQNDQRSQFWYEQLFSKEIKNNAR